MNNNQNMEEEAKLNKVIKSVKSLLLSAAREGGRSIRELCNDYRDLYRVNLPYSDVGFNSMDALISFLEKNRVIMATGRLSKFSEPLYLCCSDPLTQHIENQIRGQKKGKKPAALLGLPAVGRGRRRGVSGSRARGRGTVTLHHGGKFAYHKSNHTAMTRPQTNRISTVHATYLENMQISSTANGISTNMTASRTVGVSQRGMGVRGHRGGSVLARIVSSYTADLQQQGQIPEPRRQLEGNSPAPRTGQAASRLYEQVKVTVKDDQRDVSLDQSASVTNYRVPFSRSPPNVGPRFARAAALVENTKNAEATQTVTIVESNSSGEWLPRIGTFAENMKELLISCYPAAIHVVDLAWEYKQRYGMNIDVDTTKYYSKTMQELVQGLFTGFCQTRGVGDQMKVRCRPSIAQEKLPDRVSQPCSTNIDAKLKSSTSRVVTLAQKMDQSKMENTDGIGQQREPMRAIQTKDTVRTTHRDCSLDSSIKLNQESNNDSGVGLKEGGGKSGLLAISAMRDRCDMENSQQFSREDLELWVSRRTATANGTMKSIDESSEKQILKAEEKTANRPLSPIEIRSAEYGSQVGVVCSDSNFSTDSSAPTSGSQSSEVNGDVCESPSFLVSREESEEEIDRCLDTTKSLEISTRNKRSPNRAERSPEKDLAEIVTGVNLTEKRLELIRKSLLIQLYNLTEQRSKLSEANGELTEELEELIWEFQEKLRILSGLMTNS